MRAPLGLNRGKEERLRASTTLPDAHGNGKRHILRNAVPSSPRGDHVKRREATPRAMLIPNVPHGFLREGGKVTTASKGARAELHKGRVPGLHRHAALQGLRKGNVNAGLEAGHVHRSAPHGALMHPEGGSLHSVIQTRNGARLKVFKAPEELAGVNVDGDTHRRPT